MEDEGEKVLYFNMQEGKWNELRTNIFFLIYKHYINNWRLRKELPNETNFERTLKNETRKKVLANPTNEDLANNPLPICTGRELDRQEILEILEDKLGLSSAKLSLSCAS